MSDWPNNGCPPPVEGMGNARKDGMPSGPGRIVPAGSGDGSGRKAFSAPAALFISALGGVVASSTLPLVGSVLVGFGFVGASEWLGVRGKLLCAAASILPAALMSAAHGASSMASAVICCLAALLVAELTLRGRMTPGAGCIVVASLALCQLGVDTLVAAANGTTVYAGIEALIDAYQQQLGSSDVAVGVLVQQVRAVMSLLWPLAYVLVGIGQYLFATIGVEFALRRTPEGAAGLPKMVDYDLPLWVVAVLVAAAAGVAFGLTVTGRLAEVVLMVSANVAMALRFAFVAQGLAVLSWYLRGKNVGGLASALLGCVALYLEVQFVVLTIAGLVDVWANFRHLDRGARPGVQGSAE